MARSSQQQARVFLVFVALLVCAAIGLLTWATLSWGSPTEEAGNTETSTSTSLDPLSEVVAGASARPVARARGYSFESPRGYHWYPLSEEHGPEIFTDGRSQGFSKTREGAALAAIHIGYRSSAVNPDYKETIAEQVSGGGVPDLLARGKDLSEDLSEVDKFAQKTNVRGWYVLRWAEDEADVRVYLANPDLYLDLSVYWEDGDWVLEVPLGGAPGELGSPGQMDVSFEGVFR